MPLIGPEGGNSFSNIIGVRRVKCQATFDFLLDAEATGTTTWDTLWNTAESAADVQQFMLGLSCDDGRAVGFYFPRAIMVGTRPTQIDADGLNRERVMFKAQTSGATTTELENANFILGIG